MNLNSFLIAVNKKKTYNKKMSKYFATMWQAFSKILNTVIILFGSHMRRAA